MIKVFLPPSEKKPKAGISYFDPKDMNMIILEEERSGLAAINAYILDLKAQVIITYLEAFREQSESYFHDCDIQLVNDSIRIIHELTVLVIQNKERYEYCLENIIEKSNFMRVILKNIPEDDRLILLWIGTTIINFCKKELDECKKSQD